MKSAAVVAVIVAIASPAAAEQKPKPSSDPMIGVARDATAALFRDPRSAQFQNVRAKNVINLKGEPMQVVCGDVNATNKFGGFTGFQPFIYLAKTGTAHVIGYEGDIAAAAMISNFCK